MKFALGKAADARLVLITGPEDALRKGYLRAIQTLFGEDDFDSETCFADERSVADWVASVSTLPFLAPRRTLIVRQLLRADAPAADKNPLSQLAETSRLVLVADEERSSDPDRQRRITEQTKKWTAAVVAAEGTILEAKVNEKALVDLILGETQERGKRISRRAAELMVEMVGGSYSRAIQELDKLVVYLGADAEIRELDVKRVVAPSREWNIWAMIDAAREGRMPEALSQLRILLGSNRRLDEVAIQSIMPQLQRNLKLLYQARVLHERKSHPSQVPIELLGLLPERGRITEEKPWTQQKMMRQAPSVSLNCISECLEEVARADARLKGALPAANTLDTLEQLILRVGMLLSDRTQDPR